MNQVYVVVWVRQQPDSLSRAYKAQTNKSLPKGARGTQGKLGNTARHSVRDKRLKTLCGNRESNQRLHHINKMTKGLDLNKTSARLCFK